ncbi:hypothetical protein E2562_036711 [Oryza meyeriana var. granulata]|uniref:Uncharacterized protein n=1 Tax=Oryza meyeriana var. granulata TaxID=110450 RepID=A0A6G1CL49_9ORYZ|nr:hypothetical protein E2562_036711 [Oryza meyeriana var. granulata]
MCSTTPRGVALAGMLLFLVLLFVAGATVKLHCTGFQNAATAGDENGSLLARKILRVKMQTGEPNVSMLRQDHQRRSSSTAAAPSSGGGGPLPAGIVQGTSNLEMESMVGDSEHGGGTSSKTKSLLAVPVGIKNKAAVDKLVSKFPAEEFAVMLFHYDGAVEKWSDMEWHGRAVHVAAAGQTKWWFAKRFLHPDVVAEYEYVFLWDEDVEVDSFDPLRYLAVVRREGLEVSQPALAHGSEIHHGITARSASGGNVHRRFYRRAGPRCDGDNTAPPCTGWVEMMVPVFSRVAWRCAWGMVQNDLVHAWGLDYKLGYCAGGDRTLKVGVVDSEHVFHRGVPTLGGGGGGFRAAVRRRSYAEMQIFNRRWKQAVADDVSWTDPYPEH